LNQVFPDSPLRDVTLLLIARSSLKSGDNERAAKAIVLFSNEFPESSLKTSVEEELKVLANRHLKGEVIAEDRVLKEAARKVSTDRLARERAAELERIAKAKAEQERLARIKLEEERREQERLLAEKLAKESINASIILPEGNGPYAVGGNSSLPVKIVNRGKNSEEFFLTVTTAKELNASLISPTKAGKPGENVTRLRLAAGEIFKGDIAFKVPAEMVDGHRSPVMVKAVSTKYSDISFQKDSVLVSSAPLVRAIAKFAKQNVTPGEKLRYRVTVLNAGSLTAQNLTVRLQLPAYVDFLEAPRVAFRKEADGTLVFKIDKVDIGRLAEINMDVKVRDDCTVGTELRGRVEVLNGTLQRKDSFATSASIVKAK
jgi:uncharacterized repeat protein (TIGR01451 family)